MNLNHIRILESCHKFLNGITQFEQEFETDSLVYRYRDRLISFDTYQEADDLAFVDYNLESGYMNSSTVTLARKDLIAAFPSEEILRALQRLTSPEQARIQIFKLLSQVDVETLAGLYPNVKTDSFGYSFFDFGINEGLPIYLFRSDDEFELVAIG